MKLFTVKTITLLIQIGLGLMLLVFGLNKFFWFLVDFDFTGYPEAEYLFNALRFSGASATGKGYLMHAVGLTEVLVGLLLILRK